MKTVTDLYWLGLFVFAHKIGYWTMHWNLFLVYRLSAILESIQAIIFCNPQRRI